ncbi:WGR domain-containing protein [Ectothiorhodospira haloalkaliphila]|uniref:WGR domain-containing protein n=1 Tax=Ectothiorhodospira haloalkaliphila TaxID=421628 RepID=UPI003B75C256
MIDHLHQDPSACGPSWEHGVDLEKIDPASNCYRWYRVSLQPDLFSPVALVRERGRLGNKGSGRRNAEPFQDLPSARRAMERAVSGKIKRGYKQVTAMP